MSSSGTIIPAVLAGLATPLAVIATTTLIVPPFRQWQHARAKREHVEPPFTFIATGAGAEPAMLTTEDQELSQLFRNNHQMSIALQNETIIDVIAASTTFFVAFGASAASATIFADYSAAHTFAAFIDLAALLAVLLLFQASGRTRSAWLRWRIVTELIRHWSLVRGLTKAASPPVTEGFSTRAEDARAGLPDGDSGLPAAAARQGSLSLEMLCRDLSEAPSFEGSRIRLYVNRRVGGQSEWFARSARRMARQERQRRNLMIGLFFICVLAAFAEAVAALAETEGPGKWAALGVLIAIGLAGASTSAYVAQNSRSLKHRYETQLRLIQHWVDQHRGLMEAVSKTSRVAGAQKRSVVMAIVSFEQMMLDELVDWLSISIDDAMELAPG
jgi:hypothetical protein